MQELAVHVGPLCIKNRFFFVFFLRFTCCAIVGPERKKKKKTDLLSYEDWCTTRFGRTRVASFEHDTPSKRRKRDVADYRTPRYVEVDLCLTGDCDKVPTRLLRVKPKRQYKKGVVRSLNLGGTVSSPAQRLSNWLKQANEIPLNIKHSSSGDHSSMRKYHDFLMGKNVGSSTSSGVIVNGENADGYPDVCMIDDSDEENDAPTKPIQRPFFSIFRSVPRTTPTSSAQKTKQTVTPGPSSWHTPSLDDSPAPGCSKSLRTWSLPYISEQEREKNRIKLRRKLAKYMYMPLRKDNDTDDSIPTGVDGVTSEAKSKVLQFPYSPKECEHDTSDTRQVSVLGDATHITINAKDYATDFGGKEDSPRKYRFQVHSIGMTDMHC